MSKSAVAGARRVGFDVRTVNAYRNRSKVREYKVRALPTFIYILDGKVVRRHTGAISEAALRQMFRPPLW